MYLPTPKGEDFEKPEPGTHLAVCYQIIDIGSIWSEKFSNMSRKVDIYWELPHCRTAKGDPMIIRQRYTLSSSKKAVLRKDLEAWRNKPFDEVKDLGPNGAFRMENLLCKGCLLSVIHSADGQYANVKAVMAMQKDAVTGRPLPLPPLHNKTRFFSLDPTEFDGKIFNDLSDGLREQIAKSPEYQELIKPKGASGANGRGVSYKGEISHAAVDDEGWRDGVPDEARSKYGDGFEDRDLPF